MSTNDYNKSTAKVKEVTVVDWTSDSEALNAGITAYNKHVNELADIIQQWEAANRKSKTTKEPVELLELKIARALITMIYRRSIAVNEFWAILPWNALTDTGFTRYRIEPVLKRMTGTFIYARKGKRKADLTLEATRYRLKDPRRWKPSTLRVQPTKGWIDGFVKRRLRQSPELIVPISKAYEAYVDHSRNTDMTLKRFGTDMRRLIPGLKTRSQRISGKPVWVYVGIGLLEE